MVNRKRLLELFAELVSINNPSLGERAMCDRLKEKLHALGVSAHEDDAAAKIGGQAGNLYAYVDGALDLPPLLLSAHMDSVDPAHGKKAVFKPDGTITSDGTTVLGADDLTGVCVILEALTVLKENKIPHRPLEVLFDVAEETYCTGIQQFDLSGIISKEAYVFDMSGPVGSAAYQAPTIISFRADFHGRAAHAAFAPESGAHAIKAAAAAVSSIACGHVDDTTVNIGTISGGSANNIVPELCTVTGEVRSFNDLSAQKQLAEIEDKIKKAAANAGTSVDFQAKTFCVAYCVDKSERVAKRFQTACSDTGIDGRLIYTYGGSDNNHFFHNGIRGLVVAAGMNNTHSRQEYTSTSELEKAANLALALILSKE